MFFDAVVFLRSKDMPSLDSLTANEVGETLVLIVLTCIVVSCFLIWTYVQSWLCKARIFSFR